MTSASLHETCSSKRLFLLDEWMPKYLSGRMPTLDPGYSEYSLSAILNPRKKDAIASFMCEFVFYNSFEIVLKLASTEDM